MTLEAHFFFPINEDRVIFYPGYFVSCSSSFFYCNFIYKLFQMKINFAIDKRLEFITMHGIFCTFFFSIASSFFFVNKNLKLCYSVFEC